MKELIKKILKEEVKRTINETTSIQPSDFCSPLEGVLEYSAGPVKSIFGNKRYKKSGEFSHRHAGIDWKANPGDTIRAPYGGEIEKTKIVSKCGGIIVVNHGSGVRTKYCHVRRFIVSEGETVVKGQQIGETGGKPGTHGAGNALGPHLHYSIHINTSSPKGLDFSNAVDPESGWVDDTDCDSKTSVNKNLKRCSKFSGSHIPRDVFIKTLNICISPGARQVAPKNSATPPSSSLELLGVNLALNFLK